MMLYKSVQAIIKALTEAGTGQAVIATLNVVDADEDMTLAGAFGEQMVPMVPTHDWGHVPIGKARLHEVGDELIADFSINLKIESARDWYEALKFDLEHLPAKQEWSYGYTVLDSGAGEHQGRHVRFLKRMRVHEISPVLLGAGIGTRTLDVKRGGLTLDDQAEIVLQEAKALLERLGIRHALRAKEGRTLTPAQQTAANAIAESLHRLATVATEEVDQAVIHDLIGRYEAFRRHSMS